jgi:hypothetical protein
VADLQALKGLLEQAEGLEVAVAQLSKSKESLESDNISLTAKNKYLSEAIESKTSRLELLNKNHSDTVASQKQQIRSLDNENEVKQTELHEVTVALGKMQTKFDADVQEKESELNVLTTQTTNLNAEISVLQTRQNKLLLSISELEKTKAQLEAEIAAPKQQEQGAPPATTIEPTDEQEWLRLQEKLTDGNNKLEKVLVLLDSATTALAQAKLEHQNLKDYERRATKMLESRETSLLEREKQLQEAQSMAQRRNRILDK